MEKFERLPDMACEVTPELKQRIADANREAHALHLAVFPTVYVGAKVTDFDGNVLLPYKEYKANSFTRNWYNLIAGNILGIGSTDTTTFGKGHINIAEWNGALLSINSGTEMYGFNHTTTDSSDNSIGLLSSSGGTGYGIVCGTATTATSIDSYAIGIIENGTSSGQLSYLAGAQRNYSFDNDSNTWTVVYSRILRNTSGSAISVSETGLRARVSGKGAILFERTLLPSPISIPNNSQIEVFYTFVFTIPEPA